MKNKFKFLFPVLFLILLFVPFPSLAAEQVQPPETVPTPVQFKAQENYYNWLYPTNVNTQMREPISWMVNNLDRFYASCGISADEFPYVVLSYEWSQKWDLTVYFFEKEPYLTNLWNYGDTIQLNYFSSVLRWDSGLGYRSIYRLSTGTFDTQSWMGPDSWNMGGSQSRALIPLFDLKDQVGNIWYEYPKNPSVPQGALTLGDLDFQGHSDGFSNDLFDAIAEVTYSVFGNSYHSLYTLSEILNASDVFVSIRMLLENIYNSILNLGVLLRNILVSIMWFFDDVLIWIRNFWQNFSLILTSVVNLIVGTFSTDADDGYFSTWLDKWWNYSLKPFLDSNGWLDDYNNMPFVKLLNDIASASLGSNGEYQIKNLIVPEDLSVFKVAFENRLSDESRSLMSSFNTYNIMFVELLDNVQDGVVPSFSFPSFSLGGHTYSGFSFDLSPLLPYMPYIKLMLSAWMWISFSIYIIRTLPTIIRGSGTFDTGDANSSDNMVTLGRMTFDESEILSN